MRMRVSLVLAVAVAGLLPVRAQAGPVRDLNVGMVLTLEAPETYRAGAPLRAGGHLRFQVGLPIVFETAQPIRGQTIDVFVDGTLARRVTTDSDGAWTAEFTFDAMPPYRHTVRAVAFAGTPAETSSRTATLRRDLTYTELRIEASAPDPIAPGQSVMVRAFALDENGRTREVTEEARWSSSDPNVASVSDADGSKGMLTAIAPGDAEIVASFEAFAAALTIRVR